MSPLQDNQTISPKGSAVAWWRSASWMAIPCLVIASLIYLAAPAATLPGASTEAAAVQTASTASLPLQKAIETIELGDRVAANNPDGREASVFAGERLANAVALSVLVLQEGLDTQEGDDASPGLAWVRLLRPASFAEQLEVGETFDVSLPEMGIHGPGLVLSLEPAAQADPQASGSLVTGVFVHLAKETLDLRLEGDERPIGVTPNHPTWSVDRSSFVEAGTLNAGDRLRTADGSTRRVESITARGPPEPVFNLEIDAEHVFYVGSDGILVHNACAWAGGTPQDALRLYSKGRLPKGTKRLRIDPPEGNQPFSQYEAHIGGRGSPAIKQDGTIKHANRSMKITDLLTKKERDFLRDYGWLIPEG